MLELQGGHSQMNESTSLLLSCFEGSVRSAEATGDDIAFGICQMLVFTWNSTTTRSLLPYSPCQIQIGPIKLGFNRFRRHSFPASPIANIRGACSCPAPTLLSDPVKRQPYGDWFQGT